MVENILAFPEVDKWLSGRGEGTKNTYLSGLGPYLEFRRLNPTELIDEVEQDRQKSRREQGEPENQVNKFYRWLLNEYVQKTHGRNRETRTDKVGVSENVASSYCGTVRSFYSANGFQLDGKKLNIPKPTKKKENAKLKLRAEDVRQLIDATTNLRDKAMILVGYQSFQGAGEICSLNYGDVRKGLESGMDFIPVYMIRKKRKVEYHTVIGEEAIELLKLYLKERERSDEKLKSSSPLFAKRKMSGKKRPKGSIGRVTPTNIAELFKGLAIKSGLVKEDEMKTADINPCRSHALRSSGMSVAKVNGMNETAVEYMAGHKLDDTTKAYWELRVETELVELYRKHYHALRVMKPKVDTVKVEMLETRVMKRDDVIDALVENGKMKDARIEQLGKKIEDLTRRMDHFRKTMDLAPEEVTALSEMIRDYLNQKRIREDKEARELEEEERAQYEGEKR